MKSFFFISLATIVLLSCKTEEPLLQETNKIINGIEGQLLDSLLTPYITELRKQTDNEAGLAIGITKGTDIIYARTFGYANINEKIKTDFNTVFHIASLSKPFTAVAIAKLIEQGKLKLDDRIIDFIPEFKMEGGGYEAITIEHILTHTSGIPRNISPDDWINPSYGPNALEENLEAVKQHTLDFKPGSQFSYSNSAFDILGIVISRVSEMPFSEYVSKHVLQPSGMTQSSFKKQDDFSLNGALPYSYGLGTQEWSPYPYNEKLFPSSGLLTTLSDMCKWAQIHQGKGKFNEFDVLKETSFNEVVSPHFDTPWGDKIGLSWFLQSYLEQPIIMHTGQDTGFESVMYIFPKNDLSIVVMANRDFSRTGRIINAASEVLFKKELNPYNVSAKYKFAEVYNKQGITKAKDIWYELKKDTTDIYSVDDEDILTTGAILENGKRWNETKDVLEFYLTMDEKSTYAWRLLGNANLGLKDTINALSCYNKCLEINPNYEKAKIAIEQISKQ